MWLEIQKQHLLLLITSKLKNIALASAIQKQHLLLLICYGRFRLPKHIRIQKQHLLLLIGQRIIFYGQV